jgi:hypothetical protein
MLVFLQKKSLPLQKKICNDYNIFQITMETTLTYPSPVQERLSVREQLEQCGVEFDTTGNPVWYSHEEVFDELDTKLIDHFGDTIREMLNESRAERGQSPFLS